MKKGLLLAILFLTVGFLGSTQTCLEKFEKKFEERGVDFVSDGMHREVYISITEDGETYCYQGKARVEAGRVTAIFIKFEDETYELFEPADFQGPTGARIKDGISEKWVTKEDNRVMQVIFYKNIKPRKKEYKKVPEIDFDDI